MGAVRACRAFMLGMRERGYGRIVLTASENAVQPYVKETPYNADRVGIVNLGKGLLEAYGKEGVHVNVVSPAYVKTPTTDATMEEPAETTGTDVEGAVESFLKKERPGIAPERCGWPRKVANVIVFLCSNVAMFVRRANYRVAGGSAETAFGWAAGKGLQSCAEVLPISIYRDVELHDPLLLRYVSRS